MKLYDAISRHKSELFFLILLSIFYVGLIAFWAHAKLLFGGDGVGFYNIYDFLQSPSASGLLWAISELLSFGNYSVMFYLHLFFDTFLATSSIYLLSRVLFSYFKGLKSISYGMFASVLFLFNPWSVSLTYLSLTGDVSLGVAGFTIFLAGIFLNMNRKTSHEIKRYSPIISGIGLGISLSPFPNYIRIFVVVTGIFIICFIILLSKKETRTMKSFFSFFAFIFITVTISILFSLEYFIPIVSNIHSTLSVAASGAADHSYLGFYTGQFNNLLNELRGLNQWQYPGIFYYVWYESLNPLSLVTYLWPILVLLIPLYLIRRDAKGRIILLTAFLLLIIFWDKGQNPPLGFIWTLINQHLPTGYQFIPTGYLSGLFLNRFYPILASLSIFLIYDKIINSKVRVNLHSKSINKRGTFKLLARDKIAAITAVILVLLLVLSALPAFVGDAETYTYNGSNTDNAGFYIPNAYQLARTYLVNHDNGSALLLPPTTSNPYFSTSWGFVGYIGFYPTFFTPAKVITLVNFGGSYANESQVSAYDNLTEPLIKSNSMNHMVLPSTYIQLLKSYKISYIMLDSSINSGLGTSYNYSLNVISILQNEHLIRLVFHVSPLSIYQINFNVLSNINFITYSEIAGPNVFSIEAMNKNATLSNESYFADAGNVVQFTNSLNLMETSWFINGSFISQSRCVNITFSKPGIYNISAKMKYNNENVSESINYTVAPKMHTAIYFPSTVIVGKTYFLTGGVSGGTVFPDRDYGWGWYINGAYQSNIGDRNYLIPLSFNKTRSIKITLVVTDGLGEKAYTNMTILVVSKLFFEFEQSMTPGSIFYLILVVSFLRSATTYKKNLKMRHR